MALRILSVALLSLACFACDSKSADGKPATKPENVSASATSLERPHDVERVPGRGLPPDLKPPR